MDASRVIGSGLQSTATRITLGRGVGHAVGLTHRLLVETWVSRAEVSHALHFLINAPAPGPHEGQLDAAFEGTLAVLGKLEEVKVAPECGLGFRMSDEDVAGVVDQFVTVREFVTSLASGALEMQEGKGRGPADAAVTSGFKSFEAAASSVVNTMLRVSGTKKKRNITERSAGAAHAKANHALRWGQAWASMQSVLRVLCMALEVLRGNLSPAQAREARGRVADAISSRMVVARDVFALVKPNSLVGHRIIDGVARDIELHRGCKTLAGGDLGAALVGGKLDIAGAIHKAQVAVTNAANKAGELVEKAGDAAQKATDGAGNLLDKVTENTTKLADAASTLADAGTKLSDSLGETTKQVGKVVKTVETGGIAGGQVAGPRAHDLHAAFADVAGHSGTALSGGHVAGMQAIYEALRGGRAGIVDSIKSALPSDAASRSAALRLLTGAAGATMRRMDKAKDLAGGGVVASALVSGALLAASAGIAANVESTRAMDAVGAPPVPLDGIGTRGYRGVGSVDDEMVSWVLALAGSPLDGHIGALKSMLGPAGATSGAGIAPELMADTARYIAVLSVLVYICRGDKWYWPALREEEPAAAGGGGGGGSGSAGSAE